MVGWTDKLTLDGSVLVNLTPSLVQPPPHPSVSVLLIKAAVTWPGSEEFKSLSFACVRETLCGLQGAVCGMNAVLSTPPPPPWPATPPPVRCRQSAGRRCPELAATATILQISPSPAQPAQPSPAQPAAGTPGNREAESASSSGAALPPKLGCGRPAPAPASCTARPVCCQCGDVWSWGKPEF